MTLFSFCRSRKSALASLKSGHKKVALRHARELKLTTESREKCTSLLNRVEEVLNTIADSESTKMVCRTLKACHFGNCNNINNGVIISLCVWQVSEAIKTGARVMKDIKISPDEVHDYLEEIEDTIQSQKEVEKALGEWCFCFGSFD